MRSALTAAFLASAGYTDGVIRLAPVTRRPPGRALAAHGDRLFGVAVSPNVQTLAFSTVDHTVRLWDVDRQRPITPALAGLTDTVHDVALGPDGRLVAASDADGSVRLWDAP